MRALSFDIGTEHCVVVEGIVKKGFVEVIQTLIRELPADNDAEDNAEITPYVADAVADIMRSAGFNTKGAVITSNIRHIKLRDFLLPDGKPKELEGMVRNEMISNYSADPTDVIQFIKRPMSSSEETNEQKDGGQTRIRAAYMKRDIVDSYYSLLKRLKLTPLAMDFHANAVEKLICKGAVINDADMNNKAYLMVDFGSSGTLIHTVAENRIFISRYIPMGVADLDKAIADKEFISEEQAKSLRMEKLDLFSEDNAGSDMMKAVQGFLYQWSEEIQKVAMFVQNRQGLKEIDALYLYGIGASVMGLPEYITATTGMNAFRLESLDRVSFRNSQDQQKIGQCLNAIGALIRL